MSANAKEDNIDDFDQNQYIQEQLIKARGGHSNFSNYSQLWLHNWKLHICDDMKWHQCAGQGGITCEAIDEPRKSSKAIDKRVTRTILQMEITVSLKTANFSKNLFESL